MTARAFNPFARILLKSLEFCQVELADLLVCVLYNKKVNVNQTKSTQGLVVIPTPGF